MVVAKPKKKWVEEIEKSFTPKPRTEEIPFSVIIPTYNCSVSLDLTLSILQRQNYTPLEVIVVDAGSTDKTHDILAQYASLITRVYTTAEYNVPEMINRGVSLATGEYISSLFPNCFYVSDRSLDIFAEAILAHNRPDLVICDAILHSNLPVVSSHHHQETMRQTLLRGYAPATFTSCWFKSKFFIELGKLDPQYKVRFALDLFCRVNTKKEATVVRLDRRLVDHSRAFQLVEYRWQQIGETGKILKRHFGSRVAIKWFFTLRFALLIKLSWKYFKGLIFEKS